MWKQKIPFGMSKDDLFLYGKIVSFFGFVYTAGYMNWSISWLIVLIVALEVREARKDGLKIKSNIAKAISRNEQNALKGRIADDLTWVYFPDTEFAEWVNMIIKQCWPNINNYFKAFMLESLEHSLRSTLEKFNLTGFKFKRIILGDTPIRIINVSVNEENSTNNEIALDLDIYYSGNCDVNFIVSGAKGGISNFQLHGMLRVVLTPLLSEMPLFGGIQCFFLNNPDVKFDIVGALSVLNMPGLRDHLNKAVIDQIAYMMVLPNKYVLQLSDNVDSILLNKPNPKGVLRVHVIEAKDFMVIDRNLLGTAKSDPFVVLKVDVQEYRTQVISNTLEPKWDYWCDFIIYEPIGQQLKLTIWDKDDAAEEFMGKSTIYIRNVKRKGKDDLWVTLEEASRGKVHLRLTWFDLTTDITKLKKMKAENENLQIENLTSAVLTIYIESCSNLPIIKSGKPDPFVAITCGKTVKETYVAASTVNPAWNQSFTFLIHDPKINKVNFKVKDRKTKRVLGEVDYDIALLLKRNDLTLYQESFYLDNQNSNSNLLTMSMFLKILERPFKKKTESSIISEHVSSKGINSKIPELSIKKEISESINLNNSSSLDEKENIDRNPSALEEKEENIVRNPSVLEEDDVFMDVENSSEDEVDTNIYEPEILTIPTANDTLIHLSQPQNVGKILLTITYNTERQRAIIVVHKVINLHTRIPNEKPDPYVKLYLLPKLKQQNKTTKRKTAVRKDSCNPTFNEIFEYLLPQGELLGRKVEVSVCTKKLLSRNILGQVVIDLSNIDEFHYNKVWFDIFEL